MAQNLAHNIPHRPPMHWLDEATREPNATVVATRILAADQPFMMNGLLPRSALLEIAAQAAACGVAPGPAGTLPRTGVLAAMRDVHFFATPRSGQTILIRVRVVRSMGALFLCTIDATADGRPVLVGTFSFALHNDSAPTFLESGGQPQTTGSD